MQLYQSHTAQIRLHYRWRRFRTVQSSRWSRSVAARGGERIESVASEVLRGANKALRAAEPVVDGAADLAPKRVPRAAAKGIAAGAGTVCVAS